MKVRDRNIEQTVDVADRRCLKCSCYWPRPDPGVFTQGQGYRTRTGKQGWLCGTREIRGCPYTKTCTICDKSFAAYETKCDTCLKELK